MEFAPVRLRANTLEHPLGLGDPRPILRWELPAGAASAPPAEWEVKASTTCAELDRDEGNLWSSDWQKTEPANEALYAGSPVTSRQGVWWKVRVRNEKEGQSLWSKPAYWEAGLLEPGDWSACWISGRLTGGPRTSVQAPCLRKSFQLKGPLVRARLYVTALGLYECEINGRPVSQDVLTPGWTEYCKRVSAQTYDVTDLLKPGENVLGAILGDGWYCGHVSIHHRQIYGLRPLLLAQLEIEQQDGTAHRIISDGSWKYAPGPILVNDLLMGETYDARLELGSWSSPGFADANWQTALEQPRPRLELAASSFQRVRRQETISVEKAIRVTRGVTIVSLYDLGQNISGRVRITVHGFSGAHFQLRYGEMLDASGNLYTENLRSARAIDHYTCGGDDDETWEPRFTFHGFRYVEISYPALNVFPDPPVDGEVLRVEGIVLHTTMEETGAFFCSDGLLNKLFSNIHWGMKGNFLEVPTDCPQRDERLGWTGDAQVFASTAAFLRDVQSFFHKWTLDLLDAQRLDGRVPAVAPYVSTGPDGGPAWSDAMVICPWEIYRSYGDRRLLELAYPGMQRFVEHIRQHRCKNNIRSHPDADPWGGHGDWLALDGSLDPFGNTPKDLIGTAFLAYDLEILYKVADLLGHEADAKSYRSWHGQVVEAFQDHFVTPDGLVAGRTQTAYVLALYFRLLPDQLRPAAARELVRDIEKRQFHLTTGFVGTPYLCAVLEESGYLEIAYRLLEQKTFPSWLFPVQHGATTIWERWDGWTPEKGFQTAGMNSFNHYAYGAIGAWMVRSVAGLALDERQPGGSHLIFRPRPGGSLTWAEASLQTPRGKAAIRWEQADGKIEIRFSVPGYAAATLMPPPGYAGVETEYGPGEHRVSLGLVQASN